MTLKKNIFNFFIRTLLALILFLSISFFLANDQYYFKYGKYFFEEQIDFRYIKTKTNFLLGKLLNEKDHYVTSEKLEYKSINKYNNSYKLETEYNYVVKNINKGVVYYIGEKENLGTTVIIASDDGVNYWYSNIENISVNLYDFINTNTIIGSTKDNILIMTFTKDNEYLSYEEYI